MMSKQFRRAFFGFNRKDVIDYIEELRSRFHSCENLNDGNANKNCDMSEKCLELINRAAKNSTDNACGSNTSLLEKIDMLKKENAKLLSDLHELEEETKRLRFTAESARIQLAQKNK